MNANQRLARLPSGRAGTRLDRRTRRRSGPGTDSEHDANGYRRLANRRRHAETSTATSGQARGRQGIRRNRPDRSRQAQRRSTQPAAPARRRDVLLPSKKRRRFRGSAVEAARMASSAWRSLPKQETPLAGPGGPWQAESSSSSLHRVRHHGAGSEQHRRPGLGHVADLQSGNVRHLADVRCLHHHQTEHEDDFPDQARLVHGLAHGFEVRVH